MPKYTAADIELCVATHFNPRQFRLCPNISWGFTAIGHREVDLLVVPESRWCYEVEIKVTRADIKADLKKQHAHSGSVIRKAWFAVPSELADDPAIPDYCGVLACSMTEGCRCHEVRGPKINKEARKLRDDEYLKLMELMTYRVWALKRHMLMLRNDKRWAENRKQKEA